MYASAGLLPQFESKNFGRSVIRKMKRGCRDRAKCLGNALLSFETNGVHDDNSICVQYADGGGEFDPGRPAGRSSRAQHPLPPTPANTFSFRAWHYGKPTRCRGRFAGWVAVCVSTPGEFSRPVAVLHLAHSSRNQRCSHAPPQPSGPSQCHRRTK